MTNLDLCLHCGAHRVEREQVLTLEAPAVTKTHHPIPHAVLIGLIEQHLADVGLKVVQEVHALSHEGMRYFGMMEVVNGSAHADYSVVLGMRNANDKRFSAGIVVGSGVFVCDNLCFSGEIKVGRKHTLNILNDLPALIQAALQQVAAMRDFQDKRIATYRESEFTESQANDLIIKAWDEDVISSSKIGQVISEWRTPRHQEFVDAGKTAWRLMNAFTEILKPREQGNDLFMLPAKTEKLHNILDTACGLTISSADDLQMFPVEDEPSAPETVLA